MNNELKCKILFCMLAYYVLWHIKESWRPLTFADEETVAKQDNDPIAPAKISNSAKDKLKLRKSSDDFDIMSFKALFSMFSIISKAKVTVNLTDGSNIAYKVESQMDEHLAKAFELLSAIRS